MPISPDFAAALAAFGVDTSDAATPRTCAADLIPQPCSTHPAPPALSAAPDFAQVIAAKLAAIVGPPTAAQIYDDALRRSPGFPDLRLIGSYLLPRYRPTATASPPATPAPQPQSGPTDELKSAVRRLTAELAPGSLHRIEHLQALLHCAKRHNDLTDELKRVGWTRRRLEREGAPRHRLWQTPGTPPAIRTRRP
jgi:hypothetical protein